MQRPRSALTTRAQATSAATAWAAITHVSPFRLRYKARADRGHVVMELPSGQPSPTPRRVCPATFVDKPTGHQSPRIGPGGGPERTITARLEARIANPGKACVQPGGGPGLGDLVSCINPSKLLNISSKLPIVSQFGVGPSK